MSIRFPYSRPDVTQDDITAVVQSMQGQFLTQGPKVSAFEKVLADKFNVKHVVVCNSGTAALHLVYLGLALDETRGLLTSPLTFLATANAARMCGAPVAFADVDPLTGNISPQTLAAALSASLVPVAAVAVVHLGGRACDMPVLRKLTAERGIALIEDACHAPLATYADESGHTWRVGACAHSDAAVLSFHAIKHVAMGEGGAVLTNNDEIANTARLYRNHGMTRDPKIWQQAPEAGAPWYYEMHELGCNYRATEMQCALGLSQFGRLEAGIARRREIAQRYHELLAGLNHLSTPPRDPGHVWHLYPVAIDFEAAGKTRGRVMKELAARSIGTQVHYVPVNKQPYYARRAHDPTPGADAYYARTLSIPMYPGLSDTDLETIAREIRDVLRTD